MFHVVLILGGPVLLILLILFMVSISTGNEELREKIQRPLKIMAKIILVFVLLSFFWTNVIDPILSGLSGY